MVVPDVDACVETPDDEAGPCVKTGDLKLKLKLLLRAQTRMKFMLFPITRTFAERDQ